MSHTPTQNGVPAAVPDAAAGRLMSRSFLGYLLMSFLTAVNVKTDELVQVSARTQYI